MTKKQLMKKIKNRLEVIYFDSEFYVIEDEPFKNAMDIYFEEYDKIIKFSNIKDAKVVIDTKKSTIDEVYKYLELFVKIVLEFDLYSSITTSLYLIQKIKD